MITDASESTCSVVVFFKNKSKFTNAMLKKFLGTKEGEYPGH